METNQDALVISSELENRRRLVRILEDLGVSTFASASLADAYEVLAWQPVAVVFCDDRLTDGSYRDLLQTLRTWQTAPPLVVTTRVGEWKDYQEALGLGAFDMIPHPCRPIDVELNILRAMRRDDGRFDRAIA
jgi:DNA-binding NtrC family response regulator